MKKTFCDACCAEGASNKFQYLCHLDDMAEGKWCNGYVDNDGFTVSGRLVQVDLCNQCYNQIVLPAVVLLKKKREAQAKA